MKNANTRIDRPPEVHRYARRYCLVDIWYSRVPVYIYCTLRYCDDPKQSSKTRYVSLGCVIAICVHLHNRIGTLTGNDIDNASSNNAECNTMPHYQAPRTVAYARQNTYALLSPCSDLIGTGFYKLLILYSRIRIAPSRCTTGRRCTMHRVLYIVVYFLCSEIWLR